MLLVFSVIIIIIFGVSVFFYQVYAAAKQERNILKLRIQEYKWIIRKLITIYEKILQGKVDFQEDSLLNESPFHAEILEMETNKPLIEILRDTYIYQTMVKLKGYFSLIRHWTDKVALAYFQSSKSYADFYSISMMLIAFIGEVKTEDNSFGRYKFREHIDDLISLLNYCHKINSLVHLKILARFSPTHEEERVSLNNFIRAARSEIDSLRWKLEKLRLLEEKYRIEQGESFTLLR